MKFFPCHSQDNINMLKQYSNVYDRLGIKFIATGGINKSNYKEILSIKNVIGVGSSSIKEIWVYINFLTFNNYDEPAFLSILLLIVQI